jgi:excisionase family DNA binding protein
MPVEIMGVTLYNLREVAEKLGVSYLTAKTYHSKGRFKGQRIGRSILVSEDELHRFVVGGAKVEAVQQ